MNIAPISIFKPSTISPFKRQMPFLGQEVKPKGDVFVRQKERPLSEYYSKALAKLTKEAEEYIMHSPKVTYNGLYDIIEKYSVDVQVKKFHGNNSPNKKSIAQYTCELIYTETEAGAEEHISNQTIFVSIPKKQDKSSRALLLGSFIHEAVHMFQHETRQYVRGESFVKKYYKIMKGPGGDKKIVDAIEGLNDGYSKFEQNLFTLEESFLNLCHINSYANVKNFDRFLKDAFSMNLAELVKFLIEDAYYNTSDMIINTLGEDAILDSVKHNLSQEIEAYEAENEVMQKYSPDSFTKMGARFTVESYKEILNIINNLKFESISD